MKDNWFFCALSIIAAVIIILGGCALVYVSEVNR